MVNCHPCKSIFLTFERRGSRLVHDLMLAKVVGKACKHSIKRTVSPGVGVSLEILERKGKPAEKISTVLVFAWCVAYFIIIGT